jgi:hypothetical protein
MNRAKRLEVHRFKLVLKQSVIELYFGGRGADMVLALQTRKRFPLLDGRFREKREGGEIIRS